MLEDSEYSQTLVKDVKTVRQRKNRHRQRVRSGLFRHKMKIGL
jgi:hypothetical protein